MTGGHGVAMTTGTENESRSINFDFTGRTAVVTGAARGIGLEVGRHFCAARAATYLVDADAEVIAAADAIGAIGKVVDVSSTEQVDQLIAQVIENERRLDIVVNNAGILRDAMLWKLSDADWDSVLAVHLGGTFRMTRAAVPQFRQQRFGRVINVTSYSGLHGNIGQANYAAAKAGIVGFTKTAAKELARFGITVNAISPQARTRMVEGIPEARLREIAALVPLGRFADPSEIWPAVGFLASGEAGYITGIVLPVDGGIAI
jgi:3-oxoacyl-[acyl-carrier protein] reductase